MQYACALSLISILSVSALFLFLFLSHLYSVLLSSQAIPPICSSSASSSGFRVFGNYLGNQRKWSMRIKTAEEPNIGIVPKKPEKQIERKIQHSEPERPKIAASNHCSLHEFNRNVNIWSAYQVKRVNEMPSGFNKTRECEEEAGEKADVLHRDGGRLIYVAVD